MTDQKRHRETQVAGEDHLLDHAYDGIQEYDNPLPRWWLALFWVTIVATPLYILYYHAGPGLLALERYDNEMIAFYDKQAEELLKMGEIDESMLVGLMDDQSMMNSGEKIFQGKCATCHGMFGEGGIGPNLTDDHWIHGGQLMDVYRTVRDGVTTKGMLAWERQLRPAELLAVSSYAGSLLGSAPPNAKGPEGTPFERLAPSHEASPVEAEAASPTEGDTAAS
jgi:cytochrome c oxidase cbb3-type subunit 3